MTTVTKLIETNEIRIVSGEASARQIADETGLVVCL